MRHEYLVRLGADELDQLARVMGLDVTAERDVEAKVALIEGRRSRSATVRLLGEDFQVEMRRARDKRVADLAERGGSDADVEAAVRGLLGEGQHARLMELCTDEDGVVDAEAYALAFVQLVRSDALKNF